MPRTPEQYTMPRRFVLERPDGQVVASGVRWPTLDGWTHLFQGGDGDRPPRLVFFGAYADMAATYVKDTDGAGLSVRFLDPIS
jgi:hypothetical protein